MSDKQLARVQKRSYQVFTIFGLPLRFTVFDVLPMASSPGFFGTFDNLNIPRNIRIIPNDRIDNWRRNSNYLTALLTDTSF